MIGNDLRNYRKSQKYTQQYVSEKSHISIVTIRKIEKGGGTIKTLECVLNALECEIFNIQLERIGTIGERVAALRKKKKISQQKAANIIAVTQATISNIENHNTGRIQTLDALARVIGCTLKVQPKNSKKSFYKETAFSSLNEVWTTPPHIINKLIGVFGIFDLDPCAESSDIKKRNSKSILAYTKKDNGLINPWFGTVFVNPPYSRSVGQWVKKCYEEDKKGNTTTVIALLASRTDTKWFHSYIANQGDIFFIKGRLKFGDSKQAAPFPSMIVVWTQEKYNKIKLQKLLNKQ